MNMATTMNTLIKCRQCKQSITSTSYFYNNKTHTTCFSCSRIRISQKNKCSVCGIRACYNYTGETIGLYCSGCALPNMVDVKHPKCITCKIKRPNFNNAGETTGLYCSGCALPNMVDVKRPKCITCKIKQPNFNNAGETTGLYCSGCALPNMVDVKSPKCITCKIKHPVFNNAGETTGLYCSGCALPNMVDVKHPKCITCKIKQPNFNNAGETIGLYCSGCALPNMVDVKSPKCITCKTRASYGIPGTIPTTCVKHRTENMISNPRARCKKQNCKLSAIYGIRHPIHCESHKNDNDINLIETRCKTCGLMDVCIDELCINVCSKSEQITYEMRKRQKVKELRVFNILKGNYKEPDEYNIHVSTNCGGKNSEEKEWDTILELINYILK